MPHSVNDGRRVGRALPRLTAARPLPAGPTPSPPHSVPSEAPHGVFPWGLRTFPLSELDTRCTSRCSEGPASPRPHSRSGRRATVDGRRAGRAGRGGWQPCGLEGTGPGGRAGLGEDGGSVVAGEKAEHGSRRRRGVAVRDGPDVGAVWPCGRGDENRPCGFFPFSHQSAKRAHEQGGAEGGGRGQGPPISTCRPRGPPAATPSPVRR